MFAKKLFSFCTGSVGGQSNGGVIPSPWRAASAHDAVRPARNDADNCVFAELRPLAESPQLEPMRQIGDDRPANAHRGPDEAIASNREIWACHGNAVDS